MNLYAMDGYPSMVINIEMSISVDVNDEPLCHGWYPRVINIEMSISDTIDVNDEPLWPSWYIYTDGHQCLLH